MTSPRVGGIGTALGEQAFRAHVRTFLDTVPSLLEGIEDRVGRARAWRAALDDAGLATLGYPDLEPAGTTEEHRRWYREESRGRVPAEESVFGIGVGMALPTLRDHGDPLLQARFLRPGLRGEEIWCQLYSEPDAGSDLASLRTTARLDGEQWVVDGQKVWTSGAQYSQLAILLARTDPEAARHAGITMFVLPLDQAGVTVRPLRQMTGTAEFNEVFLSGARIPRDWVVGGVNGGWRMATALLAHERAATGVQAVGSSAGTGRAVSSSSPVPVRLLRDLDAASAAGAAGASGAAGGVADAMLRQELAALETGERVSRWLGERGGHPSIGKLWRTAQARRAADVAAGLALGGAAWAPGDEDGEFWNYHVLNARRMSIGGGTDEIQRSTLAEKALGLPREPR